MGKIGLLLPAYNEEKYIGNIIKEAKKYLPGSIIVVVDDGSRDRTPSIASKMGVKVLKHIKNRGKGEALKTGFKYFLSKSVDFVVVTDTDGQYKIKDAGKIIDALKNGKGDLVTGYRIPSDIPYLNRIGNFIWRFIFNRFFGTNLKDIACGFIGLNKNALKKMRNIYGGYIIESSLFINCVNKKLRIFQVPMNVYYHRKRKIVIKKFSNMFLAVLLFIIVNGMKHKLKTGHHFK
jgi:glycosyltransferase involved in cell wall biosynthesis